MIPGRLLWLLTLLQAIAGLAVVVRMLRTAGGQRLPATPPATAGGDRVTILLPVLNERDRLLPCLAGLATQTAPPREILVIDGGSTDGTPALVRAAMAAIPALRLIDAAPVPAGINGKAHNLEVGRLAADPATDWLLTIDADVRPAPGLLAALLAQQATTGDTVVSVATRQHLASGADAIIHPALLTTLVYRFGIPGHATTDPAAVQANGQVCLLARAPLAAAGGFVPGFSSVCEDVTIARRLAAAGHAVGFYEGGELVTTAMYGSAAETWKNWTRSLPMRDGLAPIATWRGLGTVLLAQGLPLPMIGLLAARRQPTLAWRAAWLVNLILSITRVGVLAGTRRAYQHPPPTYWLSPLADFPASLMLWRRALQRRHTWRGQVISRDTRSTVA